MTQPQGDAGQQAGTAGEGDDGFKPITSQEDLNKVLGTRLERERAKFADYDQIRSELDGFRSLADDSTTETDKLRRELEAIQSERATERTETMRLKIANAHGITDAEDLALLTGGTEELLTAQAKRLAALHSSSKKNGNYVPREGTSGAPGPVAPRDQFAALLRGQQD